jgi:ABC-type dipeptide/oligopeptide/nickel transport system permease subunit
MPYWGDSLLSRHIRLAPRQTKLIDMLFWDLAKEHILNRSVFNETPFSQGIAYGMAYGLTILANVIVLGLFFEILAAFYGGGTETFWELCWLVLSLPWPALAYLLFHIEHTHPWVFIGMFINLLLLGLGWGTFNHYRVRQ